MREIFCRRWKAILTIGIAALAVRTFFFLKFRYVAGDSFWYGEIATIWTRYGVFGIIDHGEVHPTLLRMPGYPAFLVVVFALFGQQNWNAVLIFQLLIDVVACFVLFKFALEIISERAALLCFLIAAVCPFIANYTATPLTETLAVFLTLLTFLSVVKALSSTDHENVWWFSCGLCLAFGTLLRPDALIVWLVIETYLIIRFFSEKKGVILIRRTLLLSVSLIVSLSIWTLRNWQVFGVFQPLALNTRHYPTEFYPEGFDRWVKTWITDYNHVEVIWWRSDGASMNLQDVPASAYSSKEEYRAVADLFQKYNQCLCLSPAINAGFDQLATQRIKSRPFVYYVELPLKRIVDMWFRPRIEAPPLLTGFWRRTTAFTFFVLNLLLISFAFLGTLRRIRYRSLFISWIAIRSVAFASLVNPEPRYMLECYPLVFLFASAGLSAFAKKWLSMKRVKSLPLLHS